MPAGVQAARPASAWAEANIDLQRTRTGTLGLVLEWTNKSVNPSPALCGNHSLFRGPDCRQTRLVLFTAKAVFWPMTFTGRWGAPPDKPAPPLSVPSHRLGRPQEFVPQGCHAVFPNMKRYQKRQPQAIVNDSRPSFYPVASLPLVRVTAR